MVRASARHLLELINDVLDISKIEAGQLEVHPEPFDLRASVDRVVALGLARWQTRRDWRSTSSWPRPDGPWMSDRRRVEQMLLNLLNNAMKFTDRGG